MDDGRLAFAAVRGKDRFDRNGALERTFADAEVAFGHIVGVVGDSDRLPAVDVHVAHRPLEVRAAGLSLEALALDRQAGLGAGQARDAHALGHVERRLGVLLLGQQDRLGRQRGARAHGQEVRLVVGKRAGRAGEDALHGVAREVAGLLPGIDVGRADAHAVDQVGQLDRLHRADLDALAALDATGEEILLVERAGRAQALPLRIDQRQETGHRGADHAASEQDGAQEAPAVGLPLGDRYCRSALGRRLPLVLAVAHEVAVRCGLTKRGFSSRRIRSGVEKGARRSRKSSSSMTGELRKKRATGISIQIWSA